MWGNRMDEFCRSKDGRECGYDPGDRKQARVLSRDEIRRGRNQIKSGRYTEAAPEQMNLTLKRFYFSEECTIGKLLIDEAESRIFTLEPKVREIKVYGKTAIPYGLYRVVIDYSQHFNRLLPHLMGVEGFEGVRIHPGNVPSNTEGCILVGKVWNGGDSIGKSIEAFDELFTLIQKESKIDLNIIRGIE